MVYLKSDSVSAELLHRMQLLVCKAYAHCMRQCIRRGGPACLSCPMLDVRKIHDDLKAEVRGTAQQMELNAEVADG